MLEDRCKKELLENLINQVLLLYYLLADFRIDFDNDLFCQLDKSNHEPLSIGCRLLLGNLISLIFVSLLLLHFLLLFILVVADLVDDLT